MIILGNLFLILPPIHLLNDTNSGRRHFPEEVLISYIFNDFLEIQDVWHVDLYTHGCSHLDVQQSNVPEGTCYGLKTFYHGYFYAYPLGKNQYGKLEAGRFPGNDQCADKASPITGNVGAKPGKRPLNEISRIAAINTRIKSILLISYLI